MKAKVRKSLSEVIETLAELNLRQENLDSCSCQDFVSLTVSCLERLALAHKRWEMQPCYVHM
eukprot:4009656-Amphidinium_carterae.2